MLLPAADVSSIAVCGHSHYHRPLTVLHNHKASGGLHSRVHIIFGGWLYSEIRLSFTVSHIVPSTVEGTSCFARYKGQRMLWQANL